MKREVLNVRSQLSTKLSDLAGNPSSLTLDGLRLLERKTATVCTLLKASVYSIVLQQQIFNESEAAATAAATGESTETQNVEDELQGGYNDYGGGQQFDGEGDYSFRE